MAVRVCLSACVSLCTSMRVLQTDSTAGQELHMHLYTLNSKDVEAVMNNDTLLQEKLVETFKVCDPKATRVEFNATVTGKTIERQSDMIKYDIMWSESTGTVNQEMVTGRTGVAGEKVTFLLWVDQDDTIMSKSTFTFMPNKFAEIPISNDEWKGLIASSTADIEKTDVVIGKIRHAGIDSSRETFQSDVFWWKKNGEQQINRSHYDDVLLWSGKEVQINKKTVEFGVTDAAIKMPTTDDEWEALIDKESVRGKRVDIVKVIQKGLNAEKTKFVCDVFWVRNNNGRGPALEIESVIQYVDTNKTGGGFLGKLLLLAHTTMMDWRR